MVSVDELLAWQTVLPTRLAGPEGAREVLDMGIVCGGMWVAWSVDTSRLHASDAYIAV
jgi:hypothetical protein